LRGWSARRCLRERQVQPVLRNDDWTQCSVRQRDAGSQGREHRAPALLRCLLGVRVGILSVTAAARPSRGLWARRERSHTLVDRVGDERLDGQRRTWLVIQFVNTYEQNYYHKQQTPFTRLHHRRDGHNPHLLRSHTLPHPSTPAELPLPRQSCPVQPLGGG
jgi:hypothetical protein